MPVEPLRFHIHDIEFRFTGFLFAARTGTGRGAPQKLAAGQGRQAHCGLVGQDVGMLEQGVLAGLPVPEQHPAACKPVTGGTGKHDGSPVRMSKQHVRPVDHLMAFV